MIKKYRECHIVYAEKFEIKTYKDKPWGKYIQYNKTNNDYFSDRIESLIDGDFITFLNGYPSGRIAKIYFVCNYEEINEEVGESGEW